MQNFGGKPRCIMDDLNIMVNKSSEWCFRESMKMKNWSGFLYMKQRHDAEIKWRQFAGAQLNFVSDVIVVGCYLHDLNLPVLSSPLGTW